MFSRCIVLNTAVVFPVLCIHINYRCKGNIERHYWIFKKKKPKSQNQFSLSSCYSEFLESWDPSINLTLLSRLCLRLKKYSLTAELKTILFKYEERVLPYNQQKMCIEIEILPVVMNKIEKKHDCYICPSFSTVSPKF